MPFRCLFKIEAFLLCEETEQVAVKFIQRKYLQHLLDLKHVGFAIFSSHTDAILVLNQAYGRFVEEAFPDKPLIITEAWYLPFVSKRCLDRACFGEGSSISQGLSHPLTKWMQHILSSSYFKLICFIVEPTRVLEFYMLDMYLCLPVAVVVVVMDGWCWFFELYRLMGPQSLFCQSCTKLGTSYKTWCPSKNATQNYLTHGYTIYILKLCKIACLVYLIMCIFDSVRFMFTYTHSMFPTCASLRPLLPADRLVRAASMLFTVRVRRSGPKNTKVHGLRKWPNDRNGQDSSLVFFMAFLIMSIHCK